MPRGLICHYQGMWRKINLKVLITFLNKTLKITYMKARLRVLFKSFYDLVNAKKTH